MRIAVASGKGGTGKTTVAVNLALSLSAAEPIQFLDCDVEEPNAHLFLNPQFEAVLSVDKQLPQIDHEKCTRCGACAEACEFNALAIMGGNVMVYDALCHGADVADWSVPPVPSAKSLTSLVLWNLELLEGSPLLMEC